MTRTYSYAVQTDLEKMYGKTNLRKWADLNNQQTEADITARIVWCLSESSNEIDTLLDEQCPYDIPFAQAAIPQLIVRLCATYGGVLLYESRGITDVNPVTGQTQHQLQFKKNWFDKTIKAINCGVRKLDIAPESSLSVPKVQVDDCHHDRSHNLGRFADTHITEHYGPFGREIDFNR